MSAAELAPKHCPDESIERSSTKVTLEQNNNLNNEFKKMQIDCNSPTGDDLKEPHCMVNRNPAEFWFAHEYMIKLTKDKCNEIQKD